MEDRTKWLVFWPLTGLIVWAAFGAGLMAAGAWQEVEPQATATPVSAATASSSEVLDVELGDLYIEPGSLSAPADDITIRVHNAGATEHNFSLGPLGATSMIAPGGTDSLELSGVEPGRYSFLCEVAGHAEGGMKGVLSVGAAVKQATAGKSPGHEHHMSPSEMVEHDAAVTAKFPAETKGVGGRPLHPEIAPDGTKVFELTASVVKWETEPGKVKEAWAYNGMVPGPRIEAELGDRVGIVLHNDLPEPTTLHFHGMEVPPDMDGVPVISQDAVMPGESYTYEFVIKNTGSHMYHSHFDAQKQVPMGLLGPLVVGDPKDPEIDVDQAMILNDGPLGFTINGKGFPATAPIVAKKGDLVRLRYMNEGLLIHPMHLHGLTQTVIAKDGHLLDQPYEADTILVGPGERYDALVRANQVGAWAFHCHVLNHAEGPNGMFGMVTAMVVE